MSDKCVYSLTALIPSPHCSHCIKLNHLSTLFFLPWTHIKGGWVSLMLKVWETFLKTFCRRLEAVDVDVCVSCPAFSSRCSVTSLQCQASDRLFSHVCPPVLLPPLTLLTPDPWQASPAALQGGLFSCVCVQLLDDDDALTLNAQCQSPAATLALEPRM